MEALQLSIFAVGAKADMLVLWGLFNEYWVVTLT
jgi:hypothetical protein